MRGCPPRRKTFTSVPQVVAASTLRSISPSPGRGTGTSRISISSGPSSIAPCIVCGRAIVTSDPRDGVKSTFSAFRSTTSATPSLEIVERHRVGDERGGIERAVDQAIEDLPLLVERAGIGGDDPPLALEERVQVEVGVAALRRVREEHDGAAGPRQLEPAVERLLAADRVEDGVDAEPVGQLMRLLSSHPSPGFAAPRRAELFRKPQPILIEIDHHHRDLRKHSLQHQQMQKPHAAGAENQRNAVCVQPGAADAAKHAGGRLHEHGALVRQRIRHFARGELRRAARIRIVSAKPPGSIRFSLKTSHIVSLPRRQKTQSPQGT